jgi:hypothetical protein
MKGEKYHNYFVAAIRLMEVNMAEKCELYDRDCIDCGECDMCDLDPGKHCDDCGRCIDDAEDYRSITVEDYFKQNVTKDQLKRMEKKLLERQDEMEERQRLKSTDQNKQDT